MADATPRALPLHSAALGLVLFATIALPLYDGNSLLTWLLLLAQHSLFAAVVVAFVCGAPCLFGLAVAVAAGMRDRDDAADLLLAAMQMLHVSLLLLAVQAIRAELDHAYWFAGFAFVSYLGVAGSEDATTTRPRPGPRTLARWGGAVIAGTMLWLHLQTLAELPLDVAVHVALAAALLLAATLPRDATRA
jgi:hypothetical protein